MLIMQMSMMIIMRMMNIMIKIIWMSKPHDVEKIYLCNIEAKEKADWDNFWEFLTVHTEEFITDFRIFVLR